MTVLRPAFASNAPAMGVFDDRGEGGVTLEGVEDPRRRGEGFDADLDRHMAIRSRWRNQVGIPCGAAV